MLSATKSPNNDSSQRTHIPLEYKLVLLGSGGVGKSAITIRLVTNNFLAEYDPTIEDSYRKQAVIDDRTALLDILDTAGQEEYDTLQDFGIRSGEGFVLVYSCTNRSTFEDIAKFREKILQIKDADFYPMVLVANKTDVDPASHQVSAAEGRDLATSFGIPFLEASAKLATNIEEIFFVAVREMRDHYRQRQLRKEKKGKKKMPCNFL